MSTRGIEPATVGIEDSVFATEGLCYAGESMCNLDQLSDPCTQNLIKLEKMTSRFPHPEGERIIISMFSLSGVLSVRHLLNGLISGIDGFAHKIAATHLTN